ncbi:signal peptide peptidase-like 2A isoform X1 [Takifugu rubripes]|uniref:PA domain-containing protein n=1 Tax=Takifugu rubripes TaxID=31033 RepID=H2SR20_TAKRU|nr:signal peptide peptidase-like 2A isoform X1 [Takifugu rubripes]|eukprot:XP_003969610.1 PREDICTED: signal peptide peptidase-like 2A isoform X1 [Takifugu rubripes]
MDTAVRIVVFTAIVLASQVNCQEGILHISNGVTDKEYCLVYNQSWTPLSQTLDAALQYPLVNLTSTLLCDATGIQPEVVNGKALVVMRGVCDFSQKAVVAQSLGATLLLLASNTTLITPSANVSEYSSVHIPLALMRYRDLLDAQQVFGENMQVKLYAPPQSKIDPSIVVMLLIAVVTVTLGGCWCRACERDRLDCVLEGGGDSRAEGGDLFLYSPLKVIIFVGLMSVMLLLMYFFYNILVYVIIAIFCLASASALFSCLDAVMDVIGCGTVSFSIKNCKLSLRSLVLAAVCISIAVVWGVYRNEDSWIWILQDLLGIAFCLNFMKTISLSNFKICVILLSLLLVYDVFFVFITPFFTKNGVSIMVQVALGPDAAGERTQSNMVEVPAEPQAPSEKLPVVMRVPRFSAWALNMCGMQFSILGFGDIIVPGLLVAYCSRFDVRINSRNKVYFISSCIAYLLGIIMTFAVMLLSGMGQPALLYLVPFTLITAAAVAGYRKEMRQFWTGTTYEVLESSREPLLPEGRTDCSIGGQKC